MSASGRVVLRGRWARPVAVGWFTLAALLAADVLRRSQGRSALTLLAGLALLCGVVYVLSFRPAVVYDDDRLELRNLVREVTLPWPQVTDVDWAYVMKVRARDGRTYAAWALTANRTSLPSELRRQRLDRRSVERGEVRPPSLTELLAARWADRRRLAPDGPVVTRVAWPAVAAVAIPAAALTVLLSFPGG